MNICVKGTPQTNSAGWPEKSEYIRQLAILLSVATRHMGIPYVVASCTAYGGFPYVVASSCIWDVSYEVVVATLFIWNTNDTFVLVAQITSFLRDTHDIHV